MVDINDDFKDDNMQNSGISGLVSDEDAELLDDDYEYEYEYVEESEEDEADDDMSEMDVVNRVRDENDESLQKSIWADLDEDDEDAPHELSIRSTNQEMSLDDLLGDVKSPVLEAVSPEVGPSDESEGSILPIAGVEEEGVPDVVDERDQWFTSGGEDRNDIREFEPEILQNDDYFNETENMSVDDYLEPKAMVDATLFEKIIPENVISNEEGNEALLPSEDIVNPADIAVEYNETNEILRSDDSETIAYLNPSEVAQGLPDISMYTGTEEVASNVETFVEPMTEVVEDVPSIDELVEPMAEVVEDVPSVDELVEPMTEVEEDVPSVDELVELMTEVVEDVPSVDELVEPMTEVVEDVSGVDELVEPMTEIVEDVPSIDELVEPMAEVVEDVSSVDELVEPMTEVVEDVLSNDELVEPMTEVVEDVPSVDELVEPMTEVEEDVPSVDELVEPMAEVVEDVPSVVVPPVSLAENTSPEPRSDYVPSQYEEFLPTVEGYNAETLSNLSGVTLVSKTDGVRFFAGTSGHDKLLLDDSDSESYDLSQWNLILNHRRIITLTDKVYELNSPQNSNFSRIITLIKKGQEKAIFVNEPVVKFINATDTCVAVDGKFVCGDFGNDSCLVVDDSITLPLVDFAGKKLSFSTPESGFVTGPQGMVLHFSGVSEIYIPNKEMIQVDAEKLQYKISKWYSGTLNDKYFEFSASSNDAEFVGTDEIKAIHVNVNNSSYGWNVAFDNGLSMNLRDLREYQTRFGKMPSANGVISYGQKKLTFSNVERIVVYESAQYFFYS